MAPLDSVRNILRVVFPKRTTFTGSFPLRPQSKQETQVASEQGLRYYSFSSKLTTFRDRLAAGRQTLNLKTGVRIPVPELT
jgi:hypothetical protein